MHKGIGKYLKSPNSKIFSCPERSISQLKSIQQLNIMLDDNVHRPLNYGTF